MKKFKSLSFRLVLTSFIAVALVVASISLASAEDFGERVEQLLKAQSQKFFGFNNPLQNSATDADVVPRDETNSPSDRQFLAHGLTPKFVARNVAFLADMIAYWPDDINYTHLIVCIEQSREEGSGDPAIAGENPSVQRVDLATGEVETILHGMTRCDGIRTTPWGTILATEEVTDGAVYEILDPINTTGCWIFDRGGAGVDADIRLSIGEANANSCENQIKKRTALVTQAWEGLEILDNGVVIGGDELRPGEDFDVARFFDSYLPHSIIAKGHQFALVSFVIIPLPT